MSVVIRRQQQVNNGSLPPPRADENTSSPNKLLEQAHEQRLDLGAPRAPVRSDLPRWSPWKPATGPRTAAGKAQSSHNAYKGAVEPRSEQRSRTYAGSCETMKSKYSIEQAGRMSAFDPERTLAAQGWRQNVQCRSPLSKAWPQGRLDSDQCLSVVAYEEREV